jgi:hypothetical protein
LSHGAKIALLGMSIMIASGLDISPVITHRFSYKDLQAGFD